MTSYKRRSKYEQYAHNQTVRRQKSLSLNNSWKKERVVDFNIEFFNWLVRFDEGLANRNWEHISIVGEKPVTVSEMTKITERHGFEVREPSIDTRVLILGKVNWDVNILEKLIGLRKDRSLRIYSQEMFFGYVATGRDPFSEDNEVILSFAPGHPGLEWLVGAAHVFDWPSTIVRPSDGSLSKKVFTTDNGVLSYFGYHVGKHAKLKGMDANERQMVLQWVYDADLLEYAVDNEYIRSWGNSRSSKRLQKMAFSIAAFCRNARRRTSADLRLAIQNWESDLQYLHDNYYRSKFVFDWPSGKILT